MALVGTRTFALKTKSTRKHKRIQTTGREGGLLEPLYHLLILTVIIHLITDVTDTMSSMLYPSSYSSLKMLQRLVTTFYRHEPHPGRLRFSRLHSQQSSKARTRAQTAFPSSQAWNPVVHEGGKEEGQGYRHGQAGLRPLVVRKWAFV